MKINPLTLLLVSTAESGYVYDVDLTDVKCPLLLCEGEG